MKVMEQTRTGRIALASTAESSTGWTWWIGNSRVTAAELESWQLGPDLTGSYSAEEDYTHLS
jgi:hypothetical protein